MGFVNDFYSDFSLDYWNSRLDYELERLINDGDALTTSTIIGAYSSYLQLAEIVFHHIYLISKVKEGDDAFKKAIFISNTELRKWLVESLDADLLLFFIESLVFSINPKPNNYNKKLNGYVRALKESKDNYLKYHNVLNAFKHGFRIRADKGGTLSINGYRILEAEAEINYLTIKDKVICNNRFEFSIRRTMAKAHFLLSTIENARLAVLTKAGDVVNRDYYFIDDEDIWNSTFGSYHFTEPL